MAMIESNSSNGSGSIPFGNFKNNDYNQNLLHRMHLYWEKQQLCDVILRSGIDGRKISAHRFLLSAASDYFSAMFTGSLRESQEHEITLEDIHGDALETLIKYCYTGNFEIQEDTVETLLATASLLQLNDAVTACCNYLEKQLDPSNCIGISFFADHLNCQALLRIAQKYMCENFKDVCKNLEFLKLSDSHIAKLIASDDLWVVTEEEVFRNLKFWLDHDEKSRKKYMRYLLGLIRMPFLKPSFLIDHVKPICDTYGCQDLLTEAIVWHLLPERRAQLNADRSRPRQSFMNDILVVGGTGNQGWTYIENYCPIEDTWTVWKNTTVLNRYEYGSAIMDSKLIIVGGKEGGVFTNTVKCFDFGTMETSFMSSMIQNRVRLAVAALKGNLYAVGGFGHQSGTGFSYVSTTLNSVERWNPITCTWNFVTNMAYARESAGAGVLDGKLYVIGGCNGSSLALVECYNPNTNTWEMKAPMIKKRAGVGIVALNGFLYAIGGFDCNYKTETVEKYDPKANIWIMICCLSVARSHICCMLLGERILAIGGNSNQNQVVDTVECYDVRADEWITKAQLNYSRSSANCVVVPKIDRTKILQMQMCG